MHQFQIVLVMLSELLFVTIRQCLVVVKHLQIRSDCTLMTLLPLATISLTCALSLCSRHVQQNFFIPAL